MSDKDEKDDLIEGYEGTEEVSSSIDNLSDEERAERLEKFNKRVKKQIAILMTRKKFNATQRAKAAQWLGESGEPTAIPYLVQIYTKEKDKTVQRAAEEALSQLKALGELVNGEDEELQEFAFELMGNIVFKNELGKRKSPSPRTLRLLMFGLFGLAVVLFLLGSLISTPEVPLSLADQLTRTQAVVTPPTPTESSDPQILLLQLRDHYTALDADSRLLQTQMLVATRNQSLDCALTFANVGQYRLPDGLADRPQLPDFVAKMNDAELRVRGVLELFSNACASQQPIDRQTALDLGTSIVEAQRSLSEIAPTLQALGVPLLPTPTPVILPTNTPIPTETPTPTPTKDPARVRQQILALQGILDEVNSARGKNTLLIDYWKLVRDAGSDAGCLQLPAPLIPPDFVLPQDVAENAPQLQLAADNVNLGLAMTRRSWAAFESACGARTLGDSVGTQLPAVEAAKQAYDQAQSDLTAVQNQLGR